MKTLAEYLAEVASQKFKFGTLDCCTLMADWLMVCGCPDAMADRRGAYSSREEYETLMASEGGIEKSCERRFSKIGLRVAERPAPGDVCLVRVPSLGRASEITGALYVSERLRAVVSTDIGLVLAGLPVVRAWSVLHG